MFFANILGGKAEPRLAIRRLRTVYFTLAAFDLLTIGAALSLDHTITTALERHVTVNRELSQRMTDLFELQHMALGVMAPGNNVFDRHDVAGQRAALSTAIVRFREQWSKLNAGAARISELEDVSSVEQLQNIDTLFNEMVPVSQAIFDEFDQGDLREAGRYMAEQDRIFTDLVGRIESIVTSIEATQIHLAEDQLEFARRARALEVVIALALLGIVICVVFYGVHLGRVQQQYEGTLERANWRLKHYADNVSHELRGPVNKLRLNLETLLADEGATSAYKDNVAAGVEDCEDLSRIINGLLFVARVENMAPGKGLREDTIALETLLESVSDFFEAAAEAREVSIVVEAPPVQFIADRSLLQRALANLVSNSVSHTPAGGRITLRGRLVGDSIEMVVDDNGVGIAPERLPTIFDRFEGSDDTEKSDGAGLGLGLSITRAIVDLHGGTIEILSSEGAGTQVTVRIPAKAGV